MLLKVCKKEKKTQIQRNSLLTGFIPSWGSILCIVAISILFWTVRKEVSEGSRIETSRLKKSRLIRVKWEMWAIFINQLDSFMAQVNWLDNGNMVNLIHVEHNEVRDTESHEGNVERTNRTKMREKNRLKWEQE